MSCLYFTCSNISFAYDFISLKAFILNSFLWFLYRVLSLLFPESSLQPHNIEQILCFEYKKISCKNIWNWKYSASLIQKKTFANICICITFKLAAKIKVMFRRGKFRRTKFMEPNIRTRKKLKSFCKVENALGVTA